LTFVTAMWQYPADIYVSIYKGFIFIKNDEAISLLFFLGTISIYLTIINCEIVTLMLGTYSAYTRPPVGGFITTQYF